MSTTRQSAARNTGHNGFRPDSLGKISACAVAISALLNGVALAQEPPAVDDEIRVTGTRIVRSGVNTPVPVTMVSSQELDQMAPGTLIESLNTIPQFYDNIAPDQITGGQTGGGANLNLRGAGVNRSLILLDDRRVVPSNRFGTVDVSIFPEELVSRVETITGGASASYGTDAVAGVVNFILDTDFSGFKAHSQAGMTVDGYGENYELGAAFGTDIGENMHLIVSGEIYSADAIDTFDAIQDRSFYLQSARVTNPSVAGADMIRPYVRPTNFTNGGIIIQAGSALDRVEFLPDGTFRTLPFNGVGALATGCNCYAETSQTYGVDADEQIAPEYDRQSVFTHFSYDLSDNLSVYAQGMFGHTENSDRRESIALLGPWQGRVYANNPFLPQAIRTQMAAENRQFAGFAFFGINSPNTPLGDARQVTDNELTSVTVGFESSLSRDGFLDGWELDGYYQYGKNLQDYITENGIRVDRLFMSMDAVPNPANPTGPPVCNIALVNPTYFSDCVPVNLFGGVQNISAAAAAYIVDDGKVARQDTHQDVFEVVLTGDLGAGFGAGPISAAFGAAYRSEDVWQKTLDPSDEFPALVDGTLLSDIGLLAPGIRGVIPENLPGGLAGLRFVPGGFTGDSNSSSVLFSSLREIAGGFDVRELFSEFSIPLVSGKSLVQQLDLDLAARWADYSGSGSVQAWKAGVNWQATDGIRVRATRSQDTRAATLRERFDQTRGGVNVTDPLNGNVTVTTASFSGGNPNVKPEEAQTVTVGLVFQPPELSAFSVSADWYEIDVSDAIAQLTGQNVVTGCSGNPALGIPPDPALCEYVHRAPPVPPQTAGTIIRVDNLFINLARQVISGVDLELNYTATLDNSTLGWRLFATRLNENSTQNRGGARDERAGQVATGFSLPDNKVTTNITYSRGPFSVFVQGRWIDGGILDRTRIEGVNLDDNTVDSAFYTDLNASFNISGQREWEVFLNITNVFDEEPPLAAQIVGRTGTNEFNTSLHDVLGQRFVAGFNLSL
jgi:outer membrane receptor protein involved in Fe transport